MADPTPFFVGAGATLAAQTVLQLYVIPRVEVRKRREDRWEKAVVDFADLLTGDLLEGERAAASATYSLYPLREDDEPSDEGLAVAREQTWTYRQLVDNRLRILADRIISLDPHAPALRRFANVMHDYRAAAVALTLHVPYEHRPVPRDEANYYAAQASYGDVAKAHTALLDATRALARGKPPRSSVRSRASRNMKRIIRR